MTDHDDIEVLIPWYVNGTLNEAEMDLVNRHLRNCRACTASVEREVGFSRDIRAIPAGLRALTDAGYGWAEVAARLPRERALPRSVPVVMVVALTLMVAGGSFLVGHQLQQPVFDTMTAPPTHAAPMVQVMFEPSTPEHVIRATVLDSGGTLVAGPTATGIYRIGLPEGANGSAAADRLARQPVVRWVSLEVP